MYRTTERIRKILAKLELSEAKSVVNQLVGLFLNAKEQSLQLPLVNTDKTPDEIRELLRQKYSLVSGIDTDSTRIDLMDCTEIDKIREGLNLVQFDFENCDCVNDPAFKPFGHLLGPRYFGKIPGVGCYAGGDWEHPVFFIIYLDANGDTLRSYIPKDGNMWNHDLNLAFGNNEVSDSEFLVSWAKENKPDLSAQDVAAIKDNPTDNACIMFDELRLLKDIENNLRIV